MKIVLTGGGTGGHISPILAVAKELKKINTSHQLFYIGERKSKFSSMTNQNSLFEKTYKIYAGKFRRYSSQSVIDKITDIHTLILNIRDVFYVVLGTIQSLILLIKIRPNAVFAKGGYVGVPVGLSAAILRIPIITHDSDSIPGMANKVIGRFAKIHAVGMLGGKYHYKRGKTIFTGIPVENSYKYVDEQEQNKFKQELGISQKTTIFITGGSLGAQFINIITDEISEKLLEKHKDLLIINQTGHHKYKTNVHNLRLMKKEFIDDMYRYSGAADIIVARCGASTIAEIALQKKPMIVIPSPHLAGNHQIKNAQVLLKNNAAIVIDQSTIKQSSAQLLNAIEDLLEDKDKSYNLAKSLNKMAQNKSADILADIIISAAKK